MLVELLWTAPEILRSEELIGGTHKADVYSFAIIMQEVILRSYPFDMLDKSYEGPTVCLSVCHSFSAQRRPAINQSFNQSIFVY